MMGLDEQTAFKLGQASENQDTEVHSNESMTERYTWATPVLQQKYHALTGGYHGVELAITAYALLKTHTNDESLKFLLHRLGDCFAHFDIVHDKEPLTMNVSLQQYVEAIDSYLYENIHQNRHKEWIEFMLRANHAANFEGKTYKEIKELVLPYLPTANQNKFVMYGEKQNSNCFTMGHTLHSITSSIPIISTSSPDGIFDRKDIFLLYIGYMIDYINEKYKNNYLLFKKEGLGLGDVKLMSIAGLFLGWKNIIVAIVVAVFSALIYITLHKIIACKKAKT
jgi:prepilin signal peptidase PulO-like enzyme (type II secretory pathway)